MLKFLILDTSRVRNVLEPTNVGVRRQSSHAPGYDGWVANSGVTTPQIHRGSSQFGGEADTRDVQVSLLVPLTVSGGAQLGSTNSLRQTLT